MHPSRPDQFDVTVFGTNFANWLRTLAPGAPIWRLVPQVRSAVLRDGLWRGDGEPSPTALVLPLLEPNIRHCPAGWSLVPPPLALEILADKAMFARYLETNGHAHQAPQRYRTRDEVKFPAVVKRTDMFAGLGIELVHSADELEAMLGGELFRGQPVIFQEYIEGELEYVVQAVLAGGLFVWTAGFEVVVPANAPIRHANLGETVRRVEVPARELIAMQRIIAPLGFSGPANFNYRRRANGDMALFEINPRLGGSLFRPESEPVLGEALNAIVRHATWHEAAYVPAGGA